MLNAFQYRLVEETLVEKEVYEAMVNTRARITETLTASKGGLHLYREPASASAGRVPGPTAPPASAPAPARQGRRPEFPDLPEGTPPPGMVPKRKATVRPPSRGAVQQEPVAAGEGSGVPGDVLAAADPLRQSKDRVAPYTPDTKPSSNPTDPFPQLGLKGRPLG